MATYKTIPKITFPIFKLPSAERICIDGLVFIEGMLVDDKNMPGETLGIRRLQTPQNNLLPLRRAITSLIGILKQDTFDYIDSKGLIFTYEKTLYCKLKYHRIKRIDKKEVACLCWVEGVNFPFTIPRPPLEEYTYAGILYMRDTPWLLYEYSKDLKKDTRRKV